jgi:hypothetical protein
MQFRFLNSRMDPLHMRLQIPLAVALVAAEGTALRLLQPAGGLDMLHEVMFPSVRLCALGALVPTLWSSFYILEPELADSIVAGSAGRARIEWVIVLPGK